MRRKICAVKISAGAYKAPGLFGQRVIIRIMIYNKQTVFKAHPFNASFNIVFTAQSAHYIFNHGFVKHCQRIMVLSAVSYSNRLMPTLAVAHSHIDAECVNRPASQRLSAYRGFGTAAEYRGCLYVRKGLVA